MKKRLKKKLGLPYQKFKIGDQVLVKLNSNCGHRVGTIGKITDIRTGVKPVLWISIYAEYKYENGRKTKMSLTHKSTDLELLSKKRRSLNERLQSFL